MRSPWAWQPRDRAGHVLTDASDIRFRVQNFHRTNMERLDVSLVNAAAHRETRDVVRSWSSDRSAAPGADVRALR